MFKTEGATHDQSLTQPALTSLFAENLSERQSLTVEFKALHKYMDRETGGKLSAFADEIDEMVKDKASSKRSYKKIKVLMLTICFKNEPNDLMTDKERRYLVYPYGNKERPGRIIITDFENEEKVSEIQAIHTPQGVINSALNWAVECLPEQERPLLAPLLYHYGLELKKPAHVTPEGP